MIDLIKKYKLPSIYADYVGLYYAKSTSENHKKKMVNTLLQRLFQILWGI